MKTLFSVAVLFLIAFVSCKKSEDNPQPQPPPSPRYWLTYNGVIDSMRFIQWSTDSNQRHMAHFTGLRQPTLTFLKKPDHTRLYKIRYAPTNDDEVGFSIYSYAEGADAVFADTGKYLQVTMNGSNMNFAAGNIAMYQYDSWLDELFGGNGHYIQCSFDLTDR